MAEPEKLPEKVAPSLLSRSGFAVDEEPFKYALFSDMIEEIAVLTFKRLSEEGLDEEQTQRLAGLKEELQKRADDHMGRRA